MSHLLLTVIIPFLVPFVVFFLWVRARARWVAVHDGDIPPIEKGKLFVLVLAGFVFVLTSLSIAALWGPEGQPGESYTAPRVVDGKIVPGRFGS